MTHNTINKEIKARNISEPSQITQVTVRLGLIHYVVMHVVAFKSIPSSSVHICKVSFHTDTPSNYCSCLCWAETFFLTVHENGTLLDFLTCPTHCLQGDVSQSRNVSRHKHKADPGGGLRGFSYQK